MTGEFLFKILNDLLYKKGERTFLNNGKMNILAAIMFNTKFVYDTK